MERRKSCQQMTLEQLDTYIKTNVNNLTAYIKNNLERITGLKKEAETKRFSEENISLTLGLAKLFKDTNNIIL